MVGPDTYDPKAELQEMISVTKRQKPPSGILVSAADPKLMQEGIDSAVAAGIPVVTIDAFSSKQAYSLHRHQ
jgi:ribose transport system substrate-binding protein